MKTEVRIENRLFHDPACTFTILGNINAEDENYFDMDVYGNDRGEPTAVLTSLNVEEATKLRDALNAFLDE